MASTLDDPRPEAAAEARQPACDHRLAADVITVGEDRLTLLADGPDRLERLLDMIGRARRSLRLVYYIFSPDVSGRRVVDALGRALGRGVAVTLLIDGFGSDAPVSFFDPLRAAGASVCRFLPRYGRRYLLRNHQKIAIADGETPQARAMVGGFNISDDYFAGGAAAWRDLGVLVEGPAAARLIAYVDALAEWARQPAGRIRTLRRIVNRFSEGEGPVRWLLGGPTRRLSPWALRLKRDMRDARDIALEAGYFAPNPAMLRRLERVARGGGKVEVITPSRTDHNAAIAAARHTYTRLLKRGVRIFEYQPEKLHTKLFVVDEIVHVGSANFDMRSLFLNLEIMLRVDDPGFAAHLRRYFDRERACSTEITAAAHAASAGVLTRIKWAAAYFIMAVLDANVTRRLNFGVDGR